MRTRGAETHPASPKATGAGLGKRVRPRAAQGRRLPTPRPARAHRTHSGTGMSGGCAPKMPRHDEKQKAKRSWRVRLHSAVRKGASARGVTRGHPHASLRSGCAAPQQPGVGPRVTGRNVVHADTGVLRPHASHRSGRRPGQARGRGPGEAGDVPAGMSPLGAEPDAAGARPPGTKELPARSGLCDRRPSNSSCRRLWSPGTTLC